MKLIKQSFTDATIASYEAMLSLINEFGRISYMSEETASSIIDKETFIRRRIDSLHESVVEHCVINVKIVCNRGVSHELVRHRIASYTQESTRFCNYSRGRFGGDLTYIWPCWLKPLDCDVVAITKIDEVTKVVQMINGGPLETLWLHKLLSDEKTYMTALDYGAKAQEARDLLPNALKTTVGATMNVRQWRDVFKKRALGTTGKPHPQMLEVMVPLLEMMKMNYPCFFSDLTGEGYAT